MPAAERTARRHRDWVRWALKPLVFALCALPLLGMVWDTTHGGLGANPIQALINRTGLWSVRLLLITLAVTPLRRLTGTAWPVRLRRMLGLYAFFYAMLHLLVYLALDQALMPALILTDLSRPYILVGYAAVALLIPLAVTSTDGMMRRMGARWKRLHRLVYPAAVLAVLHYLMLTKIALRPPETYAVLLALLLGYRVVYRLHRRYGRRVRRGGGRASVEESPRGRASHNSGRVP